MAIQSNLEMWAGNDHSIAITVENEAGAVVDISGILDATWELKEDESADTSLISKRLTGIEIQITHGDAGEYQVNLLPEDTEDLSGIYYWVSTVENSSGLVYTTSYGHIYIHPLGVSQTTYCTLNDVRAAMGTVAINDRTVPNSADASVIIEVISAEIKGILMGRGYELPIADTDALEYLRTVNVYGACAAFLKAKFPSDSGIGGDSGSVSFWENKYQSAIAQIMSLEFELLQSSDSSTEESNLYAGYYASEFLEEDLNEDYSEPFMRRDRTY